MISEKKTPGRPRGIGTRRHPLLRERPRGVWYPDLAGAVRGYPKTQEDFNKLQARGREQVERLMAEGKWFRAGVPDGFARRKTEWQATLEAKAAEAAGIVDQMEAAGMIDPTAAGTDAAHAREAMQFAVSVVRNGRISERERIAAARLVLEFTRQKPAMTGRVNLLTAEEFLAQLTALPGE